LFLDGPWLFIFGVAILKDLPIIGITMGDPSGVGPEIITKALSDPTIFHLCRPVVIGDPGSFALNAKTLPRLPINEIVSPPMAENMTGQMDLIVTSRLKKGEIVIGKPSIKAGESMVQCIIKAVEMARKKELAAIVTCPINKDLMNRAGYHFEGHTQLISHLLETDNYVMMLAGSKLRVTLVTVHCAYKEVPAILDKRKIVKTITITSRSLRQDFGIQNPRIAVAALNPHAGEAGLFGREEEDIILPAVKEARNHGYDVVGPLPADTLFFKAASGQFDVVVAMYHDQGLIPLKLLHFSDAVNTTLGLPIIRTSVDHGTAYDIAGKGIADSSSLKAAIRMAVTMVESRGSSPLTKK
jgi:4-hydroxythreonine-4-phosphate dehydrogenase